MGNLQTAALLKSHALLDMLLPIGYNEFRNLAVRPWLSWIERLATDQKVGGSNPSGRAKATEQEYACSFLDNLRARQK